MWADWTRFFAMGGYGLYVWGSLAMCGLVVVVELLQLAWRQQAAAAASLDNPGESAP